jgi:hypothetical protein
MQGRRGQDNEPWERTSDQQSAAVNGTGKQRAIPQRPPGMRHLDQPPPTPRVARPQRRRPAPRSWRRRLLIFGGLFAICGLLACGIGYAIFNLLGGIGTSSGPATAVTDFLSSISTGNYDQAYNDLDATITVQTDINDFKQQAQDADRCFGKVTDYTLVPNSTTVQDNTYTYSYNITREHLSKPYVLTLTLHQDSHGDWRITSYDSNNSGTNELVPTPPTCK